MSAFAAWLMGFAKSFLVWGYNDLIGMINGGIKGLCAFILTLVSLFPASTNTISNGAAPANTVFSMTVTALNWLFPMVYLMAVISFVTAGMVAYFSVCIIGRWLKVLT